MTWLTRTPPRLGWLRPHGRRRRLIVASLLGVLGLAGCIGPKQRTVAVQSRTSDPVAPSKLSAGLPLQVITFNTYGLPPWLTRLKDQRFLRAAEELRHRRPDVVVLQELWTDASRQAFLTGSDWTVVATAQRSSYAQRDGMATLTRLRVVGAEFRPFHAESLPDILVNKGALKTTVMLEDGRRLNVWNVHLQCGPKPKTRSRQIQELVDWVNTADDGQCADVIAGDFNCTPESREYQMLAAHLGDSVHELSGRDYFVTFERKTDAQDARTLDYVFVRSGPVPARVAHEPRPVLASIPPGEPLSDHVGVNVALEFPPTLLAGEDDRSPLLAFRRPAGAQNETREPIEIDED